MEPGSLTRVLGPKTHDVQNLHRLTAADDLDWFVMFSSAASVAGSPCQASYCAANAFLDSFAHYRHRRDFPATSIDWGPWADAGMAARAADPAGESARDRSLRTGISSISMADGLHMLGRMVASAADRGAAVRSGGSAVVLSGGAGLRLLRGTGRRRGRTAAQRGAASPGIPASRTRPRVRRGAHRRRTADRGDLAH